MLNLKGVRQYFHTPWLQSGISEKGNEYYIATHILSQAEQRKFFSYIPLAW